MNRSMMSFLWHNTIFSLMSMDIAILYHTRSKFLQWLGHHVSVFLLWVPGEHHLIHSIPNSLDGIHVQVLCAPFFNFLGSIPLSPLEEVFEAAAKDFLVAYAGATEGLLLTLVVAATATASSWSFFNISILGIFEAFFFCIPTTLEDLVLLLLLLQ